MKKQRAARWVLWLGGPRAQKGFEYWIGADGIGACKYAAYNGFKIPHDIYSDAVPKVSQIYYEDRSDVGFNHTAILPLEVSE